MQKAVDYFMSGCSCSESILKYAIEKGWCPEELLPCATSFSGGMGSGCLCGAVGGSQIVLGYNYGRDNSKGNENLAREKAKKFIDEFKARNKATCCRVLTHGLEGMERKHHCCKMVSDSAEILESLMDSKVKV